MSRNSAANLKSCCQLIGNVGGIGIRNKQNIFRKIYTNNSENKKKLSYTPQPLSSISQPGTNPETASPR
jgi:hypothetical protein